MTTHEVYVEFPGRIILVGFGSIGQGALPSDPAPYRRLPPSGIAIVSADDSGVKRRRDTASSS